MAHHINRAALVVDAMGCRFVVIPSKLDRSERIYQIGVSDAYSTMLHPQDGDCGSTNVGTRMLLDMMRDGRARPCTAINTDRGQAAYERDRAASPVYHDGTMRPEWGDAGDLVRWSWSRPYAGVR